MPSEGIRWSAPAAILGFAALVVAPINADCSWSAEVSAAASVKAQPCVAPAYRQFDFWVGDWDVVEVERPTVKVARARVEVILNGCVLHEIYEAADGHKGESFSIYDVSRNTWHQSWVTNSGQLLIIEGQLQNGEMMLQGTDYLPDGRPRLVRGAWRADKDGVREIAARSTDGGTVWTQWFDLLFRPHVPAGTSGHGTH